MLCYYLLGAISPFFIEIFEDCLKDIYLKLMLKRRPIGVISNCNKPNSALDLRRGCISVCAKFKYTGMKSDYTKLHNVIYGR